MQRKRPIDARDPRFVTHNVTVQQLPPSYARPRKPLSHAVKASPSNRTAGVFVPILKRRRK